MHKVISYEQIQSFVRDIRSLRNGFVTNFYWDDNKHSYWISEGSFEYYKSDNCVLMVHAKDQFVYLFYIATSFNAVSECLCSLEIDSPQIADVVCKGDGCREQDAFTAMGFEIYKHLYRMSHVGRIVGNDWHVDPRVKYGAKEDAQLVQNIFYSDFDPKAEQLPSIREIEDYVERRQLLVIKDADNICGFLIYELTGVTWYLRYWYTSPEYRNKGIGAGLLRTSLIYGIESKRQILWVIADNENAIKRYEHYGFIMEKMKDYVMLKKITPPHIRR